MNNLIDYTNVYGYRQYAVEGPYELIDVCPECRTKYTNTGEGVICSHCHDNDHYDDEQK